MGTKQELELKVAELRDTIRSEHKATRMLVSSSMLMSREVRVRRLAMMDKTLAKAEEAFDAVLRYQDEAQLKFAARAVDMTTKFWRGVQDACVIDVGQA